MSDLELLKRAVDVSKFAYNKYSHFSVGASLLSKDGDVFEACNVENASFGATICAERFAFGKAISSGAKHFVKIAIIGIDQKGASTFCTPCGVCRQFMSEFVDMKNFIVISAPANNLSNIKKWTLLELLPESFSSKSFL